VFLPQIGEIVGHKADGYIGVIIGMDEGCTASDEWVEQNNIEGLPGGRSQRFYHLLPNLPDGGTRVCVIFF
jgi:F-box protein 21